MRRNLIFLVKVYFWVEVYLFALHNILSYKVWFKFVSQQSGKTLLSVLSALQAALFHLYEKRRYSYEKQETFYIYLNRALRLSYERNSSYCV